MILVAPTAFKGTHSASAVAQAMTRAVAALGQPVSTRPVSDGGPGLIDALSCANSSDIHNVRVTGPLGRPAVARILMHGGRAVIESADACGLQLVPAAERDPLAATTFGVGELLLAASQYASDIVIGLGGSATIDGGVGMARALGWQLLDERDQELTGVDALFGVARVRGGSALAARVSALADVHSPLCGAHGAARVFGPQKGATPEQVDLLDGALAGLARIVERDLGIGIRDMPGAGAAGGLGGGLHAFAGAALLPGSAWVLAEIDADALIARASLLVTGEGAYDAQSGLGKITGELIARAARAGVPVLLVAGSVEGTLPDHVHAVAGGRHLELQDIERITREALPTALASG
ncbi:MAG TPA: glycerate kinase [Longimicrobiales bacterium]